jgi:hypothetical protein
MAHYLGVHPNGKNSTVWFIDGKPATRADAETAPSERVLSSDPSIVVENLDAWTFFPCSLSQDNSIREWLGQILGLSQKAQDPIHKLRSSVWRWAAVN